MEKEYRISEKLFSLLWATEGKRGYDRIVTP